MRFQRKIKLEQGHTYKTAGGRHVLIAGTQTILDGQLTLYREHPDTTTYWTEYGDHSDGNDDLQLTEEVYPAPTAAPAKPLGQIVLHTTVDLDTMTAVTTVARE